MTSFPQDHDQGIVSCRSCAAQSLDAANEMDRAILQIRKEPAFLDAAAPYK